MNPGWLCSRVRANPVAENMLAAEPAVTRALLLDAAAELVEVDDDRDTGRARAGRRLGGRRGEDGHTRRRGQDDRGGEAGEPDAQIRA